LEFEQVGVPGFEYASPGVTIALTACGTPYARAH